MVETQTCSFTTTVHKYTVLTEDGSGEQTEVVVAAQQVLQQVSWLVDIVNQPANDIICKHFNHTDLTVLHMRSTFKTPPDPNKLTAAGEPYRLPSSGHAAASRLGWMNTVDTTKNTYGVYLPSRMLRMAAQAAVQNLRSTARRAILTNTLINHRNNPSDLTLNDVLLDLKDNYGIVTSKAEINNRFNAISNYEQAVGPHTDFDFFDMETPAVLSDRLLAYAADWQFQQYLTSPSNNTGNTASNTNNTADTAGKAGGAGPGIVWEIKLPTIPNPQTPDDYQHVRLHYQLPGYVQNFKELNTPTIRICKNKQGQPRIILDCSYIRYVTPVVSVTRRRGAPVVGLDWGVRNPVTLIVGHLTKTGRFVLDSRPQYFKCDDLLIKRQNLQDENDELLTKIKRLTAQYLQADFSGKTGLFQLACTAAKIQKLQNTRNNINMKRSRLNHHVAYAVAHWILDQVIATGAKIVFCEDLKTLNTNPKTEYSPVRHLVSTAIRTKIFEYLTLLCERNGIVLQSVNAYNTSRTCSACDSLDTSFYTHSVSKNPTPHKHYHPPVEAAGGSWFYCTACGYNVDRDYNAAVNIARSGLKPAPIKATAAVKNTSKNKGKPTGKGPSNTTLPKVVHDRHKKFATPKRPKQVKSKSKHGSKHKESGFNDFRSIASTYLRPRRRRGTNQTHTKRGVCRVSQTGSYGLYPYVQVKQLQLIE